MLAKKHVLVTNKKIILNLRFLFNPFSVLRKLKCHVCKTFIKKNST